MARETYDYDRYNNRTMVAEYSYADTGTNPALLRSTTLSYQTNGYDSIRGSASETYHIRDQLIRSTVTNALGGTVEDTQYELDNYTYAIGLYAAGLKDRSGMEGHESTSSTSQTTRGNVTKISRWLGSESRWIDTLYSFDILGNVLAKKDARQNATSFGYEGTLSKNEAACESGPGGQFAFVTKVTNALSHVTEYTYDCDVGKPRKIVERDAAGEGALIHDITTQYTYADPLDRVKSIMYPIGSKVIDYDDPNNKVTVTSAQDSCSVVPWQSVAAATIYDGLGRAVRTEITDAQSLIVTTTDYDVLGRQVKVTNPSRWTPSSDAVTTVYDGLGRITTVTAQDGSQTGYSYAVNETTVTDPASKITRRTTDALGRVVKVVEAPAGLNYTTTYVYDILGRLSKVQQGVQTRSFRYDSLGRLTCASNPESRVGTTACDGVSQPDSGVFIYSYDDAGNVAKRTDAAGRVTQWSYDELNRQAGIPYPGSPNTQAVTFHYDTCGKGALCSVSNPSVTNEYTYNDMKWVTASSVQVGTGTPYQLSYTYDKAGNVEMVQYPSTRRVTACYDTANRARKVFSGDATLLTADPATVKAYANVNAYEAFGGVQELRMAGTLVAGVKFEHHCVNNRLQMTGLRVGTATSTDCAVASGDLIGIQLSYPSGPNNGNLAGQTVTVGQAVFTQTYPSYDGVNRLSRVQETGSGSVSGTWWADFGYDQYGNRWVSAPSYSLDLATPVGSSDYDATTNRLVNKPTTRQGT